MYLKLMIVWEALRPDPDFKTSSTGLAFAVSVADTRAACLAPTVLASSEFATGGFHERTFAIVCSPVVTDIQLESNIMRLWFQLETYATLSRHTPFGRQSQHTRAV